MAKVSLKQKVAFVCHMEGFGYLHVERKLWNRVARETFENIFLLDGNGFRILLLAILMCVVCWLFIV